MSVSVRLLPFNVISAPTSVLSQHHTNVTTIEGIFILFTALFLGPEMELACHSKSTETVTLESGDVLEMGNLGCQ